MSKNSLNLKHQSNNAFITSLSGESIVTSLPISDGLLSYGMDPDLLAAHEALGKLKGLLMYHPTSSFILRTLAWREAIQSSSIEGIECGMQELLEPENTVAGARLSNAARLTLNYRYALESGLHIVKTSGLSALSIKLIQKLHLELFQGSDYPDVPGEIRQVQNWIGGKTIADAKFVPPPALSVPDLLVDLERYLQNQLGALSKQSVVERIAIAHAQFETIHPFRDGNGRVGRLLIPMVLLADGYPPVCLSGALRQHQRQYYDTLLDVQKNGKWLEWIRFIAQIVRMSCEDLASTANALLVLRQSWENKLSHLNQGSSARELAKLLIEHPVISVKRASEILGVSFVAANNSIRTLIEQKILEEPSSSRNRIFFANQVITLMN